MSMGSRRGGKGGKGGSRMGSGNIRWPIGGKWKDKTAAAYYLNPKVQKNAYFKIFCLPTTAGT